MSKLNLWFCVLRAFNVIAGAFALVFQLNEWSRRVQISLSVGLKARTSVGDLSTLTLKSELIFLPFLSSHQYLKEQRLPPQTFIPLQSIHVKPIIERLRALGVTAKLVFDVIQYPLLKLVSLPVYLHILIVKFQCVLHCLLAYIFW
ncbi:uncharacterized protein LOC126702546 isoform X1 [Quercus robur]|uniref:uncharacterized protein LOC126702546 isoform X1 n=1 Tax=Quercus robur TaxID=38942 RepID=UPI0021622F00|nr:uncharacterized protein LOC126702546 isoform X1 [Quercus robur]